MSTKVATGALPNIFSGIFSGIFNGILEKIAAFKIWLHQVAEDQKSVRIFRFAFGVTFAVALAYAINWPLSFLTPVFTAFMLSLPLPMPTLKVGLRNMGHTIQAFGLGLIFSLFFLQFPLAYLLMLGFVQFQLYYYVNRGGSLWLTLISMIAILLLPMLANSSDGLAVGFSLGFVLSGCLTIVMVWIAFLFVPDPQSSAFPQAPGFQQGYSLVAAQASLKSTIIIFPLASLFIIFNLSDYLLVMIFSAFFIFKPELSAGKEAGKNALISTLLGGVCAIVFYVLIVAVPEYHFFITLMLLTTLFFGRNIFSGKPSAKYYASALIALLVLVNGGMSEGAEFTEALINRILLIVLAIFYIVSAIKVLDCFWPVKSDKAMLSNK